MSAGHPRFEERFVRFLRRAGSSYHAPPPTPADEMWERIEANLCAATDSNGPAMHRYHAPPPTPADEMWERIEARWRRGTALSSRSRMGAPPAPPPPLPIRPGGGRRRGRSPWVWGIGIAAVLALGVFLGRASVNRTGSEKALRMVRAETRGGDRAVAGSVRGSGDSAGGTDRRPGHAARNLAYRTVVVEHLDRTEAFLTAFRTRAAAAGSDRVTEELRISSWARDLLADTRLLLDWPADRDPRMSQLLTQLELVLAQIAQMGVGRWAEERDLIVDGLRSGDVLPRLRAAIPAGPALAPEKRGV
ncbi:MAG: hypothetical protein ACE5HQ_09240 [Gemmatimonadota bacterium]